MRVIYDLSTQPFSLGDVLVFQQMSLCFRFNRELIDFYVIYDPNKPVIDDPHLSYINKDNFNEHIKWLMGAANVNQYLNSSMLMTHKEYYGMLHYGSQLPCKNYYMYYEYMTAIAAHHKRYDYLESIKPLQKTAAWAREYLQERPVVHLRRNPHFPKRNSDYGAWGKFFEEREEEFVVVCAPHEVSEDLRLPNVEFACDTVGVDTEKICAIIEAAPVYMGAMSGPAQMRVFSDKPYCLFNDTTVRGLPKNGSYPWSVDKQTIHPGPEAKLHDEFEAML